MTADHIVQFRLTKNGPEIINAPDNVSFSQKSVDDVASGKCTHATLVGQVVTLKSIGRTVCYRLLMATKKDRLSGFRRATKVYDDADAQEPV